MIKIEALRVFIAVAECGNILDAANQLCKTPSAISMTLKHLEGDLGTPLFETDRKSKLTPLGTFLLDTAREQLSSYERALSDIRAYARNQIGELTLAVTPSIASNVIPALLAHFIRERPRVRVHVYDSDRHSTQRMVETGEVTLGLGNKPLSGRQVSFEPLFLDRFVIVCLESSPLAKLRRSLKWSDLADSDLLLNGASNTIAAPEYAALAGEATISSRNIMSLLTMVRAGFGATLLPSLSVADSPRGLAMIEFDALKERYVTGMLEPGKGVKSPIGRAFRECVLDAVPKIAADMGVELPADRKGKAKAAK